jgi:pimeloyl-ACP methyl ester carboxylesterase
MIINRTNIEILKAEFKNNKSIVFIHGFPFDLFIWKRVISFLKDNFYCISYNVRGVGKSKAGSGQFTMEMFVDDLEAIIEKLKLDKPVICGLSMGGYISLRAVERFENKLGGLILCDTKSEADPNAAKLKRAEGIKRINLGDRENFVVEFVKNCISEEFIRKNEKEFKEVLSHSLKINPVALKGCLLAMAGRTDTTEYLSKINIPVLVLCGENDTLAPSSSMKKMAGKIKNSDFAIIPNSGHVTSVENPEFVAEKIRSFLLNHFN